LGNRTECGLTPHGGNFYESGHEPVVDDVLFKAVQDGACKLTLTIPDRMLTHSRLGEAERLLPCPDLTDGALLILPSPFTTRNGRAEIEKLTVTNGPNPKIVRALRAAHDLLLWQDGASPTANAAPETPYRRKLVRLALLAPDIQRCVLGLG
jgi:hypothetical protein